MSSSLLYIPRASLGSEDIQSLVNLSTSTDAFRVDEHGGRKAAIKYLLSIHASGYDLSKYIDSRQLKELEKELTELKKFDPFRKEFDENNQTFEPYWELTSTSRRIHQLAKDARIFIKKRENGFSPEQLKVYFNTKQIENLPYSQATFQEAGFVDSDARDNMNKYPVRNRHNKGEIASKKGRVEKTIFEIEPGSQIIVLDFADERMPGGLFLYGANTQEETICYYSDLYGALLGLKYERFDGGFMIPEYGCLYIKKVKFYQSKDSDNHRTIDIVAAACYDLTDEHGLHRRPKSDAEILANTEKKLETIIASAQANTEGDGRKTYLLIGPIGCGAFKNELKSIVKLWAKLLNAPLNEENKTQKRHAFEHIWFLSSTDQKLEVFEKAFDYEIKRIR